LLGESRLIGVMHEGLEELKVNVPLILRPDRLPKDALNLELLTLLPIFQERSNVGWVAQLPNLPFTLCDHYLCVKRKGARVSDKDKPQVMLNLKSITAMAVPDVATILLSNVTKDIKI